VEEEAEAEAAQADGHSNGKVKADLAFAD